MLPTAQEMRTKRRWNGEETEPTENRHGFIVDTAVTDAMGTAEPDAALHMLGELPLTTRRVTVGGDKNLDVPAWVAAVRQMGITPHVAWKES
jgi:hypothetical protein